MSPVSLSSKLAVLSIFIPSFASAFSFQFTSQPTQCGDLSISITGGTGQPPYSVLMIPYGSSPLANNVEARTIINQQFPVNSTSVTFQLKYPANSQFVAVVSDSTTFGSGGTSIATTVASSNDSSCFNPTKTVAPDFPFNVYPSGLVAQCSASRLWWNASLVQGNPTFEGVIPGGMSFSIPAGQLTNTSNLGTGFSWTPTVRAGNTLLIVSGDDRGMGTGGSVIYSVQMGNNNCINNDSPSSTPGTPAGGTYSTSTGSTSGGSSVNVGGIVGGVIGGLAALVILVLAGLYVLRRKTSGTKARKERPVDLLQGDADDDEPHDGDLPQYYRPEPFVLTEPTDVSSAYAQEDGGGGTVAGSQYGTSDRRYSAATSLTTEMRAATPDAPRGFAQGSTAASSRKSGLTQLRAVNIIQHDDAGSPVEEEGETIELPPAYTNIRKNRT